MSCRRVALGVFLGVTMLAGASPAAAGASPEAADEAPLAFTKAEKLQVTCAELAVGVTVGIRNETATRHNVHLLPGEFSDSDGTPIGIEKVCDGLEVEVATSLSGGAGENATLRATSSEPGGFSGSLSLSASTGKVVRREVAISPKPVETLDSTPLIDTRIAKLEGSARGPIWIPVKTGSETVPPAPTDDQGKEAPQTVGAVSGPNGTAGVIYDGVSERLSNSAAKVKLELDSDGLPPGAYSGTVDLNPGDEEAGNVGLELKVAASWIIAAALLLGGIVAALMLQRLTGRMLPRARLRGRIQGLSDRHREAIAKLKKGGGASVDWGGFSVADLDTLQEDLNEQLGKATKRAAIQIDKKVLESLEAAIAVVEAQIDLLKEIPEHAAKLEDELQKLDQGPAEGFDPPPGVDGARPDLDAEARKALVGKPVKADELKPRIEEIDARAKQVQILRGLEDRLVDLSEARQTLKAVNDPKLAELDTKLAGLRYLLWTAKAAEDLDTAAKGLQDVAKMVAELWHELPPKPQMPQLPAGVVRQAIEEQPTLADYYSAAVVDESRPPDDDAVLIERFEAPASAPSTPSPPPTIPASPPEPVLDTEKAERKIDHAFLVQCLAIAVAAFVAIASGLIALYAPNETWGSRWDYVAAAIWGLGVQASVSALATSLDGLGGLGLVRRG